MIYEYCCEKCEVLFEMDFQMGKAEKTVDCPKCGNPSQRNFGSCSFVLLGGGWPSRTNKIKKQMTESNDKAGKRMNDNWQKPKLIQQD